MAIAHGACLLLRVLDVVRTTSAAVDDRSEPRMIRMKTASTTLVLLLEIATAASAVEVVARLECAPFHESKETGGAAAVSYCQTVENGCDDPVELHVVDNATHGRSGTGKIDVGQTGKVCTSHPNAIHHYTIYTGRNTVGAGNGTYSASVGRSWVNATGQRAADTQSFTIRVANGSIDLTAAAFSASMPVQGAGGGTYNGLPVHCRANAGPSQIAVTCTNEVRGQTTTWNYVVDLAGRRCRGALMNQESRSATGFGRWTTTSSTCN